MSDATKLQGSALSAGAWWTALRPVHWIKNLLLVVPAIFAQAELTPILLGKLFAGLVVCSLAASAGYLFNDIRDRVADRRHATKRFRPIAAGIVAPGAAAAVALALSVAALGLSFTLFSPLLAALIGAYLLATVSYTAVFKRLRFVDVLILAGLYVWRLLIGGAVSDIVVSAWLLGFGYVLFVTLALAKRLDEVAATGETSAVPGRAYGGRDRLALRLGAWCLAGLSMALLAAYIAFSAAADNYYRHHAWLWVAAALMGGWLIRIVRCAEHGRLRGDPVVFAASDPASLVLAVGVGVALIAAV